MAGQPVEGRWVGNLGADDGDRWITASAVLIVQNPVEQRLVDPDAALVFDIAQLAKAIHKEADARTRRTDHFGESFLRDGRDERLRFARLAAVRH